MNVEKLLAHLSVEYNIVDCVDLAILSETPGAALKFFRSVYQPQYDARCRIVVYTNNSVISDDLVAHIYRAANFVDVSTWFVLLVTPVDITQQLSKVCATSSSDPIPMQNTVLTVEHSKPLSTAFALPSTICAIPWSNLEIGSNGTISPCCMSTMNLGNVQQIKLQDAFHSTALQSLRQQFLDGQQPSSCLNCWNAENQGLTSIRQHNTKRLHEAFVTDYLEHPRISTVDLKFQNTCNFKCRICSPESSSLFADESRRHLDIPIMPATKWSESDEFIDQFIEHLPNIFNIDMYGGEPFLIKKFARVLEKAVQTGVAKNIRLHYNSNGSVWPGEFIPYWPLFRQVDIHFSIDAVGKQFELERGGVWDEVESNILRIKNLNLPNLSISVMPAVGAMNVFYIDQVIEWAAKHNFPIFVSHVRHEALSLKNLTANARAIINARHKNSSWPEMQSIIKALKQLPISDGQMFRKTTEYFDTVRNQSFSKTHPEIAKAMGYVYNSNINDSY